MKRPDVAIIGSGRLARALAPALRAAGYDSVVVIARDPAGARRFRRACPGVPVSTRPATARNAAWVLLAVPDRALEAVVASLLVLDDDWRGRVVMHHAGASGLEILEPLANAGAAVGVLHPLQALGPAGGDLLRGSSARVEGHPAAERLARDLDMRPIRLADGGDPALYHAAASLAANDLAALLAIAVDAMVSAGIEEDEAFAGILRLAEGALSNLRAGGMRDGLTGPVVRGDAETIRRHLAALRATSEEAAEIHRLLSRRLARLASGGRRTRDMTRALSGRGDDPAV